MAKVHFLRLHRKRDRERKKTLMLKVKYKKTLKLKVKYKGKVSV
jgi:hypothetical protein